MSTISDKINIARELENTSNSIRNKISELNYEKSLYIKMNKSTEEIDLQLNKLRDELSKTWGAFEVLRDELGDEYSNRMGDNND